MKKLLLKSTLTFALLFAIVFNSTAQVIKVEEMLEEEPPPPERVIERTATDAPAYPPPPPPPPPPRRAQEIFQVVEQMPEFPGCEHVADKQERKTCAQDKLLKYIYNNIKYPTLAREHGVKGTCVIRFYVDKDGSIKEPTILKDIGAGCGQEALRVVQEMNNLPKRWSPGKQRGQPVKVYFNLPIKFRLEGNTVVEQPQEVVDQSKIKNFKFTPKPYTSGIFLLSFDAPTVPTKITIKRSGEVILSKIVKNTQRSFSKELNLSKLPSGNYLVVISQGMKRVEKYFMIY